MMIEFKGIEFETAHRAIQWTEASGRGEAILLDGRNYVVERTEAERLGAAGAEFAFLHDHEMPDGEHRIIAVPIN